MRGWFKRLAGDDVARILAKGASAAFAVNVIAAIAGMVAHATLANILGVRGFGDYVYVLGWVNVLTLFTTVGLDTAAIRFIPAYVTSGELGLLRGLLKGSHAITVSISLLAAVGLYLGARYLVVDRALVVTFAVGCALLVVLSLLRVVAAQVQATKRILLANGPIFVMRPALLAGGVGLASVYFSGVSASDAMWINLAGTTISLAITSWFLRISLPAGIRQAKTKAEYSNWFRVMAAFVFYAGFIYLMYRVDILMIGSFIGTENAGLYSVASQVAGLVVFGLHSVSSIATPVISDLFEKDDRDSLRRILRMASAASFAVAIAGAAVLIVAGPYVLRIFGPEFPAAYPALRTLCFGMLAYAAFGLGSPVMNMTNHHKAAAVIAGAALLLNLLLNALLIPRHGIDGAAMATAISTLASNLVILGYVLRRQGLNPSILPLGFAVAKHRATDAARK